MRWQGDWRLTAFAAWMHYILHVPRPLVRTIFVHAMIAFYARRAPLLVFTSELYRCWNWQRS